MHRILMLLLISLYPFLSNAQSSADTVLRVDQHQITNAPNITDTHKQTGKIVVEIHVDKKGNVILAEAGAKGTTIKDEKLLQECQAACLQIKFSAVENVPEIQVGYMTFVFKSKTDSWLNKKDTARKDRL